MGLSELVRSITEHFHMEWMVGMDKKQMALPDICFDAEKNLQLIHVLNNKEQVSEFYKPKW